MDKSYLTLRLLSHTEGQVRCSFPDCKRIIFKKDRIYATVKGGGRRHFCGYHGDKLLTFHFTRLKSDSNISTGGIPSMR